MFSHLRSNPAHKSGEPQKVSATDNSQFVS